MVDYWISSDHPFPREGGFLEVEEQGHLQFGDVPGSTEDGLDNFFVLHALILTRNPKSERDARVAQAFQPAGSGDFPVASSRAETRDWKVP